MSAIANTRVAKHWLGTLNNPTAAGMEVLHEIKIKEEVEWMIFQVEKGESGTIHVQLAVSFKKRKTFAHVKKLFKGERQWGRVWTVRELETREMQDEVEASFECEEKIEWSQDQMTDETEECSID